MLGFPPVWELSRLGLDATFGLYRRREQRLRDWGLLEGDPSVLDIGCGIGQYSTITAGDYLGVDVNCAYVDHARRRRGGPRRSFKCLDAVDLAREDERFDLTLMVDFLHHLSDEASVAVLGAAGRLARGSVVCFEPVAEQQSRLGRWFIEHDRGGHMRRHAELLGLFGKAGLEVVSDEPLRLGPIATRAIRIVPTAPRP